MSYRNESNGTITADEGTVSIAPRYHHAVRVGVQLAGTFTAGLVFEVTLNGTNWVAVELNPTTDMSEAGLTSTASAAGVFTGVLPNPGLFRVRADTFVSGPVEVSIVVLPN